MTLFPHNYTVAVFLSTYEANLKRTLKNEKDKKMRIWHVSINWSGVNKLS